MTHHKTTKVLTFGTFDRLHPGHIHYLTQAQKLGDKLFTIVALDTTVLKTKHKPAIFNQLQRKQNLQNLKLTNHQILLGHPTNPYYFLNIIQPDIIALGYDQTHFTEKLENYLSQNQLKNTKIIRLESHQENFFKSSIISKFTTHNAYT